MNVNLTQKLGETDSEALKEQLAEMLIVEIFEQEQESVSIKIVSDYVEAAFCFGTEREVTAKKCGILLEIPGFEHRFYGDGEIRKMLEKYEEECDWWEYIWVDGWERDDTLLARSAQEVVSELPGRGWEAAEGSEKEILLVGKMGKWNV